VLPTPIDSTRRASSDPIARALVSEPHAEPGVVPAARVLKFGGSSLATPDRIRDVARIILESMNGGPVIIVVSAFQGVTDELLNCARLAERQDHAHRTRRPVLRGRRKRGQRQRQKRKG